MSHNLTMFANCTAVTAACPVEGSIYGYRPSLPVNAFFLGFFALSCFINLVIGIRYRTWTYLIAMFFGCMGEAVGYAGRILLHNNAFSSAGFNIQICCLIISPAFFSAAIYLILKHLVLCLGPEYSTIKPHLYTWVFICCDIFRLVLQGAGGGIAASANTDSLQSIGNDLMMAGIVIQAVTLMAFAAAASRYFLHVYRRKTPLSPEAQTTKADRKFQLFCMSLIVAFTTVFTRCVYRIAEMAGGWGNSIMQDEITYIILDGVMITIAVIALTIFHPGYTFPRLATSGKAVKATADVEKHLSDESLSSVEGALAEAKAKAKSSKMRFWGRK